MFVHEYSILKYLLLLEMTQIENKVINDFCIIFGFQEFINTSTSKKQDKPDKPVKRVSDLAAAPTRKALLQIAILKPGDMFVSIKGPRQSGDGFSETITLL